MPERDGAVGIDEVTDQNFTSRESKNLGNRSYLYESRMKIGKNCRDKMER